MLTPVIMEYDLEEVGKKLQLLRGRGSKRVHFDIGDGMFSDYLGVTPADLQTLDLGGLELDLHLLVDDPTEWIEESLALRPKRIIGQIERMGKQEYFVKAVESYGGGVLAGLGVALETPIESLEKRALAKVGVILLLAVPAGTSGSKFDKRVVEKIGKLREFYGGAILIDGGIDKETAKIVIQAGATEVGANSAYWEGRI